MECVGCGESSDEQECMSPGSVRQKCPDIGHLRFHRRALGKGERVTPKGSSSKWMTPAGTEVSDTGTRAPKAAALKRSTKLINL